MARHSTVFRPLADAVAPMSPKASSATLVPPRPRSKHSTLWHWLTVVLVLLLTFGAAGWLLASLLAPNGGEAAAAQVESAGAAACGACTPEDMLHRPWCVSEDGSSTATCVECYRDDHCLNGQCQHNTCIMPACSNDVDCPGSLVCDMSTGVCGHSNKTSTARSAFVQTPCEDGNRPIPLPGVSAGGACGPTQFCGDGLACLGGVCKAHRSAAGVYVAQDGVPAVAVLPSSPSFTAFVLAPSGRYPLQLSLHADGPERMLVRMHRGAASRQVLFSGQVYWHLLATEEEQAAFSAVRRYTGQALTADTYLAVAQRTGSRVAVLRMYNPNRTSFFALTRNYAQSNVRHAGPGAGGFTYVVWVV